MTIRGLCAVVGVSGALVFGAVACGDDSDSTSSETTAAPTTDAPATTAAPVEPAAAGNEELCAKIDELDATIDAMDPESPEQLQSDLDTIRADLNEAKEIAGDEFATEFEAFEEALAQFQSDLEGLGGGEGIGGLLEGATGMADSIASLAAAGDALDEAVDCPGGDDLDAEEEELDKELDEEEQELEQELEQEFE